MILYSGMRAALCMAMVATLASAAWSAQAQISASAETQASAVIADPASITTTQNLVFTVSTVTNGAGIAAAVSGVNANGVPASFTLTGAPGTAVSVSAPAAFNVTRDTGGAVLTIRTQAVLGNVLGVGTNDTPADGTVVTGTLSGGLFNSPIQVVGLLDKGQLSFNIAGAVTAENALIPGNYSGVLKVIAQYN